MLPVELKGPGETISYTSPEIFLTENIRRFPNLDPDFISQICFEHPCRIDSLLPHFDVKLHAAQRVSRSVSWFYDNVRYERNQELDFWGWQFDNFLASGKTNYKIFTHMIAEKNWPFPPVILAANFAFQLGAPKDIGRPYYLIEGTHRASYMRRMMQLEMVPGDKLVELIELIPK